VDVRADESPDLSVVVLTVGNRPSELRRAVDSALDQGGVDVEVVVVANGTPESALALPNDERVTVIAAEENRGIPGGRNIGADRASAPLLAFLDDDARFADRGVLARATEAFGEDPSLGVIALRIVDDEGVSARRHVPRLGSRNPERSGPVTAFLGGAAVIRRTAFADAGRYADGFVYAMEESDLALRLIDRGWGIHYDGTPAVVHPKTDPSRHPAAAERTMRNRLWLAYRNLPVPLAVAYVVNWLLITTLRRPRQVGDLLRGALDGWRTRPRGERVPIRWSTVLRLTRLGRPPLV
jgi:GT2 family glycosyltransferase